MNRFIGYAAAIAFAGSAAWPRTTGRSYERFAKTIVKKG